ncbi:ATP-binding protein [Alloalcanivorax sp. C16-1]|uniref:ATP-binding protein n=1 Tax=Alloalcanivorax sp. C16-1 TaxID=3390051 RepID=UPI003970BA7E
MMNNYESEVIPSSLAITAMRDSGYKNTAYAIAELIDNAQQAGAKNIEVLCLEKAELVESRRRSRINKIAVMDDGSGMDAKTLRAALQFGNGTRLGDRSGIGRFGMGLPNSSISQAGRVDVWTWKNGYDNAVHSYLCISEIESGDMRFVPEPEHSPVPEEWRELSDNEGATGTLVVWSEVDARRLTWKGARATLQNTEKLAGRIYRYFIEEGALSIRLFAKNMDSGEVIHDDEAKISDPLYLMKSPLVPEPFSNRPMFDLFVEETHSIEYEGAVHEVKVRYSVAKKETADKSGTAERGKTAYGRHAKGNIGVSLIRARREIVLDHGWCIGYDPRERWWGAEVIFTPELDEVFGVTNNKQAAVHFSELAGLEWEDLAEDDEEFRDVVSRLKDDGDPRAWLLELSDSIKRNLGQLRSAIKSQAAGGRSTGKTRHNDIDDVTDSVNDKWKDRSKETPIESEGEPLGEKDYDKVKEDLVKGKDYSEDEADEIIGLIKEKELRVIFLEADFPDEFQLFSVDIKGSLTEITFNRKHPAFDDVFGTVNTVDEDVNDLTKEEVLGRLGRAINASKIIFAAWARYEREAGLDKARQLSKIRLNWGQIAADFLTPDMD